MNKTIIAIDPGASGGIAYQHAGGIPTAMAMPKTEGDIVEAITAIEHGGGSQVCAYVEQVGGFIGGNPAPGSAMFNFGRNFGFLLGVIQCLGIRIELVRPQAWQKELSLGANKEGKTVWKNKLKAKSQQLYPHLKVTLQTADALLLLEYAKRRAA